MRGYRVAIVGATGLAGQELIKVLEQRRFPMSSVVLFTAGLPTGQKIHVAGQIVEVKEITDQSFTSTDIAIFAAGDDTSRMFVPAAVQAGAVVIDTSTVFRMVQEVPLVIPEANIEDARQHRGIIASPSNTTVQLVIALHPIHRVNKIKRIVITTCQSVSGTGTAAIEELSAQARQVLAGQNTNPHTYPHQIAFNILPETDVFMDNGYTREEWRLLEESRKVMHAPDISVAATCVRVPVFNGCSEAVFVTFSHPIAPDEARYILAQAKSIKLLDDPSISLYPQPWSVAGNDDVYVGRIRQDSTQPNSLSMWVVADNIRKGTALNAVQIAEEVISRKWLHL